MPESTTRQPHLQAVAVSRQQHLGIRGIDLLNPLIIVVVGAQAERGQLPVSNTQTEKRGMQGAQQTGECRAQVHATFSRVDEATAPQYAFAKPSWLPANLDACCKTCRKWSPAAGCLSGMNIPLSVFFHNAALTAEHLELCVVDFLRHMTCGAAKMRCTWREHYAHTLRQSHTHLIVPSGSLR